MQRITVGLSGYSYKPWQGEGRFYPPELKQKEFLAYYADRFGGVEIDATWYRMPSREAVQAWIDGTPDHFRFAFKMHRKVSHIARLKEECLDTVKFFCERLDPMLESGKLGCVFVQLPPNFKKNAERLQTFVNLLPERFPWAVEFRHNTWNDDETADILASRKVAYASWDTDDEAGIRRDTGSQIYARLRRDAYDDETIASWAGWFKECANKGKPCYVFFKHEDEGSPWLDAARLLNLL